MSTKKYALGNRVNYKSSFEGKSKMEEERMVGGNGGGSMMTSRTTANTPRSDGNPARVPTNSNKFKTAKKKRKRGSKSLTEKEQNQAKPDSSQLKISNYFSVWERPEEEGIPMGDDPHLQKPEDKIDFSSVTKLTSAKNVMNRDYNNKIRN